MLLTFIDRLGEYNPQLFRELKGRLKPFSSILAVASSLLLQLVVFLFQIRELPDEKYSVSGQYSLLRVASEQKLNLLNTQLTELQSKLNSYKQVQLTDPTIIPNLELQIKKVSADLEAARNFLYHSYAPLDQIDWTLWWRDHWEYIFLTFTVIFVFTLLVGGTYLLINDLAKEEHRGTLNFIRLSPQSETSILTGKLLGVPSLIYLFVFTAIPLHLWAGRSAKIATSYIFAYYATLVASCLFFYSAALLFGLVSRLFSNFQPWLGSGVVLLFLFMTWTIASSSRGYFNNPTTAIILLSPWDMINYLFPNLFRSYSEPPIQELQFFFFPIGQNFISLLSFNLLNYGLWIYGIGQAMKRCFRNPNATIINKRQSYLFMVFAQVILWGLTISEIQDSEDFPLIIIIGFLNFAIIFSLIFVLSHQRQTIIDWARYRHQNNHHESLWQDLIWGEKSPAMLAIFINLAIAAMPIFIWVSFAQDKIFNEYFSKITVLLAVALSVGLMMIYATIAQLMLLLKTQKRYVWSVGTVSALIFLPPMILQILGVYPRQENALAWLFSTFPWAGLEYADSLTSCLAILGQLTVITLLNFQLNKQVKVLGESATKALLAGR